MSSRRFDDFVSASKQRGRNGEAERLRRSHVQYELELDRLLNGKSAGRNALQDLMHLARGSAAPRNR
jgi:hypothetical protein